jgi:GNAT superfamily N-acetyltransferase
MAISVTDLAAGLPDVPRLVETRAILLSGACEVLGDAQRGDYVVRSLDAGLAAVVGRPSASALRETAARSDVIEMLCSVDAAAATLSALSGWQADPAAIHVLGPVPAVSRPRGPETRLVGADEPLALAHLPAELRRELEAGRARSPFAVGFAGGLGVSFAYAPWQTEALFDLSIDTLEAHRRRGLGAAAAALLIEHLRTTGKQPVWGALEENGPSLRLAARLGFVPVDRLFVLSRR